jgi:hypothetical protein
MKKLSEVRGRESMASESSRCSIPNETDASFDDLDETYPDPQNMS